jgi:hypothetical protein
MFNTGGFKLRCQSEPAEDLIRKTLRAREASGQFGKLQRIGCKK